MAIVGSCGFNSQQANGPEGEIPGGIFSYSAENRRTGVASLRLNPASGQQGFLDTTSLNGFGNYLHWGFYIASMPTVARVIAGDSLAAGTTNIILNLDQTLSLRNSTTVIGTTPPLYTNQWYFIGLKNIGSATGVLMQLDGVDVISGTYPASGFSFIGCNLTEASDIDIYIDDVIVDDAGFLSTAKVGYLRPVSDVSNTGWTGGAGGTTNLWQGLDLRPPGGVDSATETDLINIKCADSSGTADYTVQMATYESIGLADSDTIIGVQIAISHGEDIATGIKSGTFESVSNPVIASTGFNFGNNIGAHDVDTVGVGFWTKARSSFVAGPALTLTDGPQVKFIKTDVTTRAGCIDYCAMNVVYIPITDPTKRPAYVNSMTTVLAH